MDTKTVNLRDVPEDLVRRAKAYAAWRGMSLKEFILEAMLQALDSAPGPMAMFTHQGARKEKGRMKKR